MVRPRGVRVLSLKLIRSHLELRIRCRQGHACLQPPPGGEVMTLIRTVRVQLKWDVDIGRLVDFDLESWSGHPNDFMGDAAEADGLADHRWFRAKAASPKSVGQDSDIRSARQVLFL